MEKRGSFSNSFFYFLFQYNAGNTLIANLLFYWLNQPVKQQISNQSHFHLIRVHELQVNVLDSKRWYNHNKVKGPDKHIFLCVNCK